jgi:RHS repeat-associated protein
MRIGNDRYFLLSDHPSTTLRASLGSTSITANSSTGALIGELRYKAWGEQRYSSGTTYTNRRFTGQIRESSLGGVEGLYFYNARWVDVSLARFAQADSIILEPGDPQAWDRYAYVNNNPVKYTDPSGHNICDEEGNCWDQGQRVPGLRFGKPPDDEPPPVVHYIYGEMIKNGKSNVTLFILALNSQSQFLTGEVAKAEAYTLWG